MIVRRLRPGDVDDVDRMAAAWAATEHGGWARFTSKELRAHFVAGVGREDICALGAERHGRLVGVIVGHVFVSLFSDDLVGEVLAWWVDPGRRSGPAGLALLQAYEDWTCAKNAKLLKITATTARGAAHLGRLGYTSVEFVLYRRVE